MTMPREAAHEQRKPNMCTANRGNDLAMKRNLAPPTGATLVDEWDNIGAPLRAFDGPEWRIKIRNTIDHGRRANIVVSVVGLQYADGHAECEIIIDCPDTPIITADEARKLATALIAAADSAEGATCAPHPAY
jgi:hypothetical protein